MKISIDEWVERIGMPLVTTDDGLLCFLIDTGASFNVLLRDGYEHSGVKFEKVGKEDYILGMDGEPQKIFLVKGTISLGGEKLEGEFGVMDATDALHTVQVLTGRHLDGALGVDFLKRHRLIVDFNELVLRDASDNK